MSKTPDSVLNGMLLMAGMFTAGVALIVGKFWGGVPAIGAAFITFPLTWMGMAKFL